MEDLRDLVKELEKAEGWENKIKKLQDINKALVTQYVIRVGDLTIEPLWVEAYYYDKESFPDCNTHMNDKQKGHCRFGKLYLHAKTEINGGVDICLSEKDDYYLSFLIKASLIEGEFCKQQKACGLINQLPMEKEDIEEIKNVLVKKEMKKEKDCKVVKAARVGLTKPCFYGQQLAACTVKDLDILEKNGFDFPDGYKKQWKYSVCALSEIDDEDEARARAKEKNGAKIENKYWNLAKESLGIE